VRSRSRAKVAVAGREWVVGVAERFGDGGEIALSLQHVANLLRESWGKFCCRGVNPNRQASSSRPEGCGGMF
jgi:hypothetical protein